MKISRLIIRKVGQDDDQFLIAENSITLGSNRDCDVQIPGPGNTIFSCISLSNNELSIERKEEIISLLKFCKSNGIMFANIKPLNFIHTANGIKLIDYGRSFIKYSASSRISST